MDNGINVNVTRPAIEGLHYMQSCLWHPDVVFPSMLDVKSHIVLDNIGRVSQFCHHGKWLVIIVPSGVLDCRTSRHNWSPAVIKLYSIMFFFL